MWRELKDGWKQFQEERKIKKVYNEYVIMLALFADELLPRTDRGYLLVYYRLRDNYRKLYKDYYNKWGERPDVGNEYLIDPLK